MIKDWSKATTYIGVAAVGAGFAMIFLAWDRASNLDFTPGQIPYLISGGVGGLGLVIIGAIVLLVQNARRDRAVLSKQLEDLDATMARVVRALLVAGDGRMTSDGLVVAGPTSFHRPYCSLVEGQESAERMPKEEAQGRGLEACRICQP
jgi:hypothetical protein